MDTQQLEYWYLFNRCTTEGQEWWWIFRHRADQHLINKKLSYRKQIARKLRTHYVEGI